MKLQAIREGIITDLINHLNYEYSDYYRELEDVQNFAHEALTQCIDQNIPIYNADLLALCMEDLRLGYLNEQVIQDQHDSIYNALQASLFYDLHEDDMLNDMVNEAVMNFHKELNKRYND